MPKINVYLPDDLADAVRESGVGVSAICQRALEAAVRRMTAIREAALSDLDPAEFANQLVAFTPRLVSVLALATERAKASGAATVTTGDLLAGVLGEGANLALQILTTMEVAPASLTAPETAEPGTGGAGLRFSRPAAVVLEQTVGEAIGLGHNYVGCEHLLIALAGETDGAAGELLRSRGIEARSARQSVAAALAGYAHLRASLGTAQQPPTGALLAAVRGELTPLIERIERLEARVTP
jgi:ATP-dependent Clp protease ATP-binding subunit ClpC